MNQIHAQSVVGVASESVWVQAQIFQSDLIHVELVILLKKKEEGGVLDLASLGGAVLEKFHEDAPTLTSAASWKAWVENEAVSLDSASLEVETVLVCVQEMALWAWGTKKMKVLIKRGEQIGVMGGEEWGEGIGGTLQVGDILIVGKEEVVAAGTVCLRQEESYESMVEQLSAKLYADPDLDHGVAVVGEVRGDEVGQGEKKKVFWPTVFVRRGSEPRQFNTRIGLIVVGMLVLLIGVGGVRRTIMQAKEVHSETMGRIEIMLNEARSVATDNPERARILFAQSQETLRAYLETKPKAAYARIAEEKLSTLSQLEREALKVRESSLRTTFELSLLDEGLKSSRFVGGEDGVISLYTPNQEVVGMHVRDLSKTTTKIERGISGPYYVEETRILAMTAEGIWETEKKGEQKLAVPNDEVWGVIRDIATFGNNIYLLDVGQGEIWKYPRVGEGYGERARWFGRGITLDLSRIVDWVVDGEIWLLSASGKLERYSRGVPVAFALSGLPSATNTGGLNDPVALAVTEDELYILERGASRVVVFTREGNYREQYSAAEFGRATDLYIYEGKGYVLVDNVIKEWEL